MADLGLLALAGLGVSLGLRHGIDWDHIAAITDITGSVVGSV
jgi:high-affinity nickel permease